MKKLITLLPILILLTACTTPEASTPTAALQPEEPVSTAVPTSTAVPPTEIPPTEVPPTEVLPTAVPPTATPEARTISLDTLGELLYINTFGEGDTPRTLTFSPDSLFIASAGGNTEDFDIRIWDAASGNLLHTLSGHTGIVWTIAFSPDGNYLASASNDGTGKIWDWKTGSLVESLDFPSAVSSVTFSPDGQTIAFGGVVSFPDAAIWTFAVPSWQPEMELTEFWNIPAVVFSPDGEYIVGGGTSRNARIWRASDGLELSILYHSGQVTTLAISPDNTRIATGLCETAGDSGTCAEGAVWLWDLKTGELIQKIQGFDDWIEQVAYSVDGSLLLVGARNGKLSFYSTSNTQLVLNAGSVAGNGLFALSPDGSLLATLRRDGVIDITGIRP